MDLIHKQIISDFCNGNKLTCNVQDTWIDITVGTGTFCIEQRPSYCDRGRFTVKAFSSDYSKFYIDESDCFPRYYFKMENLLSELKAYIDFNKDKLKPVH